MTDIDILNRMIKDAAKIQASEVYEKKAVTLIEDQTRNSKVEISGIPSNAIIIKIDSFPPPEHIFSCSKGECKRADFAIIAESKGKKRILYMAECQRKGTFG